MARILSLCFIILVGCANPMNQKTAQKYHEWGTMAEKNGDLNLAKQNYSRALISARMAHSPKSGISMATYNLGRVTGYLCDYAESEKLLLESLFLEEETTGPGSGLTSMRLFELARLYFDQGFFQKSIPYFRRGISNVEALGIENSDPIGFSNLLADFARALTENHQIDQAKLFEKRIRDIHDQNYGKQAGFKPTRYNTYC